MIRVASFAALGLLAALGPAWAGPSPGEAREALERAGGFFHDHLNQAGTYVWRYSPDGAVRQGEGKAPPGVGWVQPPGTPAVGAAYLAIFRATGEPRWLEAANEAAQALVRTQLLSGGWYYSIHTDPAGIEAWCYRSRSIGKKDCARIETNKNRDKTVLDDNTTQSALNFLMMFDTARHGADEGVRQAIDFGLKRLRRQQYANGAFFPFLKGEAPGGDVETPARASLPAGWSRTWVKPDDPPYFVTNDDLPRDTGRMFLAAHRLYGREGDLKAAVKLGDFLLAAQLPAPQEGWSQTYDAKLQPVWGRTFEPPSVSSYETAGNLDYLLDLFGQTGDRRYLEAAGRAAAWLKAVRLPDGLWSRFYELGTNRPIYVDNDEKITFADTNLLGHYGMKGPFGIEAVLARLAGVEAGTPVAPPPVFVGAADALDEEQLASASAELISALDAQGRWIDDGWIEGKRFVDGVFILSRFVELADERDP